MAYEELPELEAKLEAASIKLKELSQAGGDAVHELRAGMDRAWNDLVEASKQAAARLKSL
jgi:hypothetical protein